MGIKLPLGASHDSGHRGQPRQNSNEGFNEGYQAYFLSSYSGNNSN